MTDDDGGSDRGHRFPIGEHGFDGPLCALDRRPDGSRKRINVALQGGGSHGAFTWGVLDYLLDDGRIEIEAISGTSAGAINGAVLASGLAVGGHDGARLALRQFWRTVSRDAAMSPIQRSPLDVLLSNWSLDNNPALIALEIFSRLASPYQFNPMNLNPLDDLLRKTIDFDAVKACDCIKLFVCATNVHTGRPRIFTGSDVTVDAVMASACLPHLFHAVTIDGVPYWDGGYSGNPVLSPFLSACTSQDIVIVQVNPIERRRTPRTAREIQDRVNEISFNSPLIRELRHMVFINECLARGDLKGLGYRPAYLHQIGGDGELMSYGASSKLNAEWGFFKQLFRLGRASARAWLDQNFEALGERTTLHSDILDASAHIGYVPETA